MPSQAHIAIFLKMASSDEWQESDEEEKLNENGSESERFDENEENSMYMSVQLKLVLFLTDTKLATSVKTLEIYQCSRIKVSGLDGSLANTDV